MKNEIDRALQTLRSGGLILYPTDTVWGIGCDATNAEAVERIYRLKCSVNKKSMLVLLDKIDNVVRYTERVPAVAWDLFETASSPLTLILPGAHGVAANLIPDERTLAIRIADHQFCKMVIARLGRPLVSTSANISGTPSPVGFDDIARAIVEGVDMVVDRAFEGNPTGTPSSIIMIGEGGLFKIIR